MFNFVQQELREDNSKSNAQYRYGMIALVGVSGPIKGICDHQE